jgi:hypothetical protein
VSLLRVFACALRLFARRAGAFETEVFEVVFVLCVGVRGGWVWPFEILARHRLVHSGCVAVKFHLCYSFSSAPFPSPSSPFSCASVFPESQRISCPAASGGVLGRLCFSSGRLVSAALCPRRSSF